MVTWNAGTPRVGGEHFSGGRILVGEITQMVAAAGRKKVMAMAFCQVHKTGWDQPKKQICEGVNDELSFDFEVPLRCLSTSIYTIHCTRITGVHQ